LITYETQTFDLFDDGAHDDGAMEEDGIFGNPLAQARWGKCEILKLRIKQPHPARGKREGE
jgi:hypothetical protein